MRSSVTMVIGICLSLIGFAHADSAGFEYVLKHKVLGSNEHVRDLEIVAGRERVRSWLPSSPSISYSSNDNYSWRAWSLGTSIPIPIKSLYRDSYQNSKARVMKAEALNSKQEILRNTVEIFLECSVPFEMTKLIEQSLKDQSIITSITASLYATGSIPQADRVASELQLRQLNAQVRIQKELADVGCEKWKEWSDEAASENNYAIQSDISTETLKEIGMTENPKRDLLKNKLESLTLNRESLWSKYIPDLDVNVYRNNYFDPYLSGGPPVKYTYSWTVGITLPFNFPFYDNTEFRRESAEIGMAKLQAEYERSETEKSWEQAKKDWRRISERLMEINGKDLALAEAFVESSVASYRSGKVGLADLVLARKTRLELKIEEINLKAQKLIAKTVCLTECEK